MDLIPQFPTVAYYETTCSSSYILCMHKHPEILEILLITAGEGEFYIDGKRYPIEAGDVIVCDAGSVHDILPSKGGPWATSCIGLTNVNISGLKENCLLPVGAPTKYRAESIFFELNSIAKLIDCHIDTQNKRNGFLCSCLGQVILEILLDNIENIAPIKIPKNQDFIDAALKYVEQHYTGDVTLNDVAKEFHMTAYYFSHLFKKCIGYPFMQYVIRRRIGEAQSLLMNTTLGITEVASISGFPDSSHFSKLFVKHVGISPQKYRTYRGKKAKGLTPDYKKFPS